MSHQRKTCAALSWQIGDAVDSARSRNHRLEKKRLRTLS